MPHVDITVDGRNEQVPREEFDRGPPGEDSSAWEGFDQTQRTNRWIDWYRLGGRTTTIDAARSVARSLERGAQEGDENDVPMNAFYGSTNLMAKAFTVDAVQIYGPAPGHGAPAANQTEQVLVSEVEYKLGPPDATGRRPRNFDQLTDAQKEAAWQSAMDKPGLYRPATSNDGGQVHQVNTLARTHELLEQNPYPFIDTTLQKLSVWGGRNPKTAWTGGMLIALGAAAGIGFGVRALINALSGSASTSPNSPTGVSLTGSSDSQGNTLVVNWAFAAGSGEPAASFEVELTSDNDDVLARSTLHGESRQLSFSKVPDGVWSAKVFARSSDGSLSSPASSAMSLTLPTVKVPPVTTSPGKPTNVQAKEMFNAKAGGRVLLVSWDAPSGTPEADAYKVSLKGTQPVVPEQTSAEVLVREFTFEQLEGGTYEVTVEAFAGGNGSGRSAAISVVFAGKATNVPAAPTGVKLRAFVPDGATQSSLSVVWDEPLVTDEVSRHQVTLVQSGTALNTQQTTSNGLQFDGLVDGAYDIVVQAINSAGPGQGTTAKVTIDVKTDAGKINWSLRVGQDQIDEWEALAGGINNKTETEFWQFILSVLKPAGTSTAPSFEEQLALVSLLTGWIKVPATVPVTSTRETLATRLRSLTQPPFPAAPPGTGTPYGGDALALWTTAQNLTYSNGARVVLRVKLFVIQQALLDYLGMTIPELE